VDAFHGALLRTCAPRLDSRITTLPLGELPLT
jgi:hypothetical protein